MAVRTALESQRNVELEFADQARREEKAPKGWPAALLLFHVGMWRERLRDTLAAAVDGREYALSGTADEINDTELAAGIGTPLSDASARADHLLTEIGSLFEQAADKPIRWFAATSTTEAVLRNTFSHSRGHIVEYLLENGDVSQARKLLDDGLADLEALSASEYVKAVLVRLRDDPRFADQVTS